MTIARGLAIATAVAALAGTGTLAASAAVLDREESTDQGTEVIEDFCDSGTTFTNEFSFSVFSTVKTRGEATLYFADRSIYSQTFTNLDTGKTFSITGHGTFRDHKITVNDDGTLTIVQQFNGTQIVRDAAGRVLFLDTGVSRFSFVVDYNGTLGDADDDVVLDDLGRIFRAGKEDTLDRDFCEDVLTYTA